MRERKGRGGRGERTGAAQKTGSTGAQERAKLDKQGGGGEWKGRGKGLTLAPIPFRPPPVRTPAHLTAPDQFPLRPKRGGAGKSTTRRGRARRENEGRGGGGGRDEKEGREERAWTNER